MRRTIRAPALLLVCAIAACGRGQLVVLPEPEPLPPDQPVSEAEVLPFVGLDPETLILREARAAEERAAAEADSIASEDAVLRDLFDPADFDLPIHHNERVQFWIDYFQGRGREWFAGALRRMGGYEALIRERLRARGMPEDLVYLALIESGFSPVARSHAGAVGIWQFIPGTARSFGLRVDRYLDERRDPVRSTEAALDYLQGLYDRFGSWYLAAAAYNTGENRVERILRQRVGGRRGDDALFWEIDQYLPRETRHYVPRMIAAAIVARYPERYGFADIVPDTALAFDVVTIPDATEVAVMAEAAGTDEATIRRLNPQLLRGVTPPGRRVEVRVPAGHAAAFEIAYARIPPSRRVTVLEHVVRPGETLSHIAARYGTTVRAIQEANRIRNPHSVRAGRRLVVRIGPGADQEAVESARTRAGEATGQAAKAVAGDAGRAEDSDVVYTVRPGDSLWSIARQLGVGVDDLRAWNGLDADAKIFTGQKLTVRRTPRLRVHRVEEGDTLWSIARRHGVTVDELLRWNNLAPSAVLRPGDELRVPATQD